MKGFVLSCLMVLGIVLLPVFLSAQDGSGPGQAAMYTSDQKFALVIGNANYSGLTPLVNPVNDANDISAVLEYLGFTVDKILNGSRVQMEDSVVRLKDRLSAADNAYGFFFYAGHGVQSGGENFLIPVDANIPSENYLRDRAVSVQALLDELNDARNGLNVVVLDACRDNPFGWSRSGTRGLSIVNRQPANSIIVYATSAGQRASDGDGRNGLFTSQLINNLATPGLEVKDVFNRTGQDVARVSNNQQLPAIYSQFFGTAYLGEAPVGFEGYIIQSPTTVIIGGTKPQPGKGERSPEAAAKLWTVGASVGSALLAEPWLIGTLRGTLAPVRNLFFEIGFDGGAISGNKEVGYFYLFPYAHAAFYMPFKWGGMYAGAGGGYLISQYKFPERDESVNSFAADVAVGVNLFSFMDISLTYRTTFKNNGFKASVGYIYRFN